MFCIFKREMNEYEKKFLDWMGKIPDLPKREKKVRHSRYGTIYRWAVSVDDEGDFILVFDYANDYLVCLYRTGEVRWGNSFIQAASAILHNFRLTKGLDAYRRNFKQALTRITAEEKEEGRAITRKMQEKLFK